MRLTTWYANNEANKWGIFRMFQGGFQEPSAVDGAWDISAIGEKDLAEYAGYARLYYLKGSAMGWIEGAINNVGVPGTDSWTLAPPPDPTLYPTKR